jgi:hypothetical protein
VRQAMWTAMAAAALAGSPAAADIPTEISDNRVAVETAWSVFVGDDPKECWVVSAPQNWSATRGGRDVTSSAIRGEIGLYVTFRPADNVAGEVSFGAGYPLEENSQVTVEVLIAAGTPEKQAKMRVGQIWQWIYQKGVRDFAAMTNLAKDYRAMLAERFEIRVPEVVTRQVSEDGTRKYLLRIAGGHEVETVYIPEDRPRHALHLVPGRLHADLHVLPHRHAEAGAQPDRGEIVGQIMLARDDLGEWPEPGRRARASGRGWCRTSC